MALMELYSHAFIVRIWWEKREIAGKPDEWRGMIEHVPTSRRRYFRTFDAMVAFMRQCANLPEDK